MSSCLCYLTREKIHNHSMQSIMPYTIYFRLFQLSCQQKHQSTSKDSFLRAVAKREQVTCIESTFQQSACSDIKILSGVKPTAEVCKILQCANCGSPTLTTPSFKSIHINFLWITNISPSIFHQQLLTLNTTVTLKI